MSDPGDPSPAGPSTFHVDGEAYSVIFAPHPTTLDKQGIWLFNGKTGDFWELVGNNNFVLRPRSP